MLLQVHLILLSSSFAFFCTGRPADIYLPYLCEFSFSLFLFSRFILRTSLFEAISLSFDACLVFVTLVLALCRDGLKQMSNLPFLFLLKMEECIVTNRADDLKFPISNAQVISWG